MASFEKKEGCETDKGKPLTTTGAFEAVAKGTMSPEDAADSLLKQGEKESSWLKKIRNAIRHLAFLPDIIYDKDGALYAVNADGENLKYISEKLRDDKEVVLEAVRNNGMALRYASLRLRDDEEVVLAAVTKNGEALEYASERQRGNLRVAIAAVGQNGRAMRFAAQELWGNKELIALGNNTYKHRKRER